MPAVGRNLIFLRRSPRSESREAAAFVDYFGLPRVFLLQLSYGRPGTASRAPLPVEVSLRDKQLLKRVRKRFAEFQATGDSVGRRSLLRAD